MKPPSYQPEIIEEQARRLLEKAEWREIYYALWWGVSALLISVLFVMVFGILEGYSSWFYASTSTLSCLTVAAFFAWVGYQEGKERAFEIRLKAQELLLQLQIEKNTRRRDQPTFDAKNQV